MRHFAQYVTHSHFLSQQFQLLHSATFHAASLLRAATLHTVPLFRTATRQSASTQTVTLLARQKVQPKIASAIQPLPLSHQGVCIICTPPQHHATTATPLRHHTRRANLIPSHGSTPRADTTIHNRQPSATLECVTRCLTFSVASTPEKLPSSNGTFLDVHSTYSGLCICIECVFADILIYIHRHP